MKTWCQRLLLAFLCSIWINPAQAQRQICTAAGCGSQIKITLRNAASEAWKDGAYKAQFLDHRGSPICEVEFTLPEPIRNLVWQSSPSADRSSDPECRMSVSRRSAGSVFVVELDYARSGDPRRIRLISNGRMLLDRSLNFSYRVYYPNGKACGPTCRAASTEMTVASD